MESIVAGNAPYETWNPATAVPVVGTDICGFPRDGVRVSFTGSQVQIDGCRLKSVNHSHPPSMTGRKRTSHSLALTPHLHRPVLAQQILSSARLLRRAFNPHSVIAVTEARVVANLERQTRHPRRYQQSDNGRQPADQHHHFETENGVRHPRRDRLAADYKRPIIGSPDRDPITERHAQQSTDKSEPPHRAWRRPDRFLQLVARRRCIDANHADVPFLQRLDGADGGVELPERPQYAAHQAYSPGVSGSNSKWRPAGSIPWACGFRSLGGTISFTSAIATTGNCLMKSKNHIANQPKLPARIE